MRSQSVIVTSIVLLIVLCGCALLTMRRYGISVELTRNAEANSRARELQAQYTLQKLASDPKLTIESEGVQGLIGRKKGVVLCVLSRHILPMLLNPTDSDQPSAKVSLLGKLATVDVEPVSFTKDELPSLIDEIAEVNNNSPSSALASDLSKLAVALHEEELRGSGVVFY